MPWGEFGCDEHVVETNKMQVIANTVPGIQSIHLYICARGFVKMHSKIMIFSIYFHSCKVCGIMKSKNANQKPSLKKY